MLTGRNLVAGEWRDGAERFAAVAAASGAALEPTFAQASTDDVADACVATVRAT